MKLSISKTLLGISIATLSLLVVTGQAKAAMLTTGTTFSISTEDMCDSMGLIVNDTDANHTTDSNTGWQYTSNPDSNGVDGFYWLNPGPDGINHYQMRGVAVLETATSIIVALNANMPLGGAPDPNFWHTVTGNQIGWGDLFFNFKGETFDQAQAAGDLFGIRFSSANASTVGVGLYSDVKAQTLTDQKDGYTVANFGGIDGGLNSYESQVIEGGGKVDFGDVDTNYFTNNGTDNTFNLDSIATGTLLSPISFLSTGSVTQALLDTGYNASLFNGLNNQTIGTNTIAFEFNKSAIANNAQAAAAANIIPTTSSQVPESTTSDEVPEPTTSEQVPEPTTIGGILLGGLLLKKMKANRKLNNVAQ